MTTIRVSPLRLHPIRDRTLWKANKIVECNVCGTRVEIPLTAKYPRCHDQRMTRVRGRDGARTYPGETRRVVP